MNTPLKAKTALLTRASRAIGCAHAEIAAVVALLASAHDHWVTGQVVEASGGYRL